MRTLASNIALFFFGAILVATASLGFFGIPLAHAECTQDSGEQYCLLEPLPLGGGATYDKYDPKVTNATDYVNLIIKVFISIIGVLGVIMIVLGGVQYMTTDAVSKKEGGREMISNSIFGLLLALASWLILNTINPHLLEVRIKPPQGIGVSVTGLGDQPGTETIKTANIGGQTVSVTTSCSQASVTAAAADGVKLDKNEPWASNAKVSASDADYRTKLNAVGVTVNKSNCAKVGDSGCTSVYKLGNVAVAGLQQLRDNACTGKGSSCKLTLTGGTECWLHSSHEIGNSVVDLSVTPELEAYVKKTPKVCDKWIGGQASDGCPTGQAGKYTIGSTVIWRESDHYHVSHW